ncbi:MAG: hypothetical protein FJ267_04650 [Planctomycetes bacterium]|nr:hypothetical protein [Planctomycetota bacterium]
MFKHSTRRTLCTVLAGLLFAMDSVQAQVTLATKYVEGSQSTTLVEKKVDQRLTLGGQEIPTASLTILTTTSTVGNRTNDMTLSVVDKVNSIQSEINLGGIKLQFSSANPDKKADLPQLEPILDVLRALLNLPSRPRLMERPAKSKTCRFQTVNSRSSVTLPRTISILRN